MTTNAIVFRPDPVLIAAFASCTLDGKWCSDEKVAIVERLQTESDFEARFAAFEDLQRLWYEQAPMVKLVNNYGVAALSSNVRDCSDRCTSRSSPSSRTAGWKRRRAQPIRSHELTVDGRRSCPLTPCRDMGEGMPCG